MNSAAFSNLIHVCLPGCCFRCQIICCTFADPDPFQTCLMTKKLFCSFIFFFFTRSKTLTTQHTEQHSKHTHKHKHTHTHTHTCNLLCKAGRSTGIQALLTHAGCIVSVRVIDDYISFVNFSLINPKLPLLKPQHTHLVQF